jgi:beta-lactamase superfamily II metal-dependent hydrolase
MSFGDFSIKIEVARASYVFTVMNNRHFGVCILAIFLAASHSFAQQTLQIYFIDVEGGQATLIVTPAGQSMLVDAGFTGTTFNNKTNRGRDANRILTAARNAGLKKIDFLLITHFHEDHDGGVPDVAAQMPIDTFIDHRDVSQDAEKNVPGTLEAFQNYAAARAKARRHIDAKPGFRIPLKGTSTVVVSSGGQTLTKPMKGTANRNNSCGASAVPAQEVSENPRSTGFLLEFGKFRFLDLGDLSGKPLFDLACPNDLLGAVDVYLVAHHGGPDAADPGTFAAFQPRLAVLNNGERKGGGPATFELLHTLPKTDVWQLHKTTNAGAINFADQQIANLDETTAHWLKITARNDGSFRITNGRTGFTKEFGIRR